MDGHWAACNNGGTRKRRIRSRRRIVRRIIRIKSKRMNIRGKYRKRRDQ